MFINKKNLLKVMNVSHKQLVAFVQVANAATFAEAAEKMFLSQPALSIAIKKLEQELGGRLFSRSTRKVQLSVEGEEFLPIAIRLLNDWDNALDDMSNLFAMRRGKLTIAAMPSFANSMLPTLISQFHQSYQNVNIGIMDVVMESVIQSIREGRAEVGFTFESEQMEGLDFYPLFRDEFIAVVPVDSILSKNHSVSWELLAQHDFVAMNRGSTVRQWIDENTRKASVELNIVAEAGQLATIGQLVKNGLGVSVMPAICRQQMTEKGLRCIPLSDNNLLKQLGMIKVSRKNLSVPAESFWDLVAQQPLSHL